MSQLSRQCLDMDGTRSFGALHCDYWNLHLKRCGSGTAQGQVFGAPPFPKSRKLHSWEQDRLLWKKNYLKVLNLFFFLNFA